MQLPGVLGQLQRLRLKPIVARLRDPAQPLHPVEHVVAAEQHPLRMVEWVVVLGRPGDAGQRGSLEQVEPAGGLAEVELRRGLEPVDAVAHVDLVQVEPEDLCLRVLLLHPDREGELLELALDALVESVRSEGETDQLLGDGRAALNDMSRSRVLDHRADQRGPVQCPVLEEVRVLDGEHRLAGVLGDRLERHDLAVVEVHAGENRAVRGVDRGALREPRYPGEVRPQGIEAGADLVHPEPGGGERRGEDGRGEDRGRQDHGHEEQDGDRLEGDAVVDGSGVTWLAGAWTAPRWRGSRRAATGVHAHGVPTRIRPISAPSAGYDAPPCVPHTDLPSS